MGSPGGLLLELDLSFSLQLGGQRTHLVQDGCLLQGLLGFGREDVHGRSFQFSHYRACFFCDPLRKKKGAVKAPIFLEFRFLGEHELNELLILTPSPDAVLEWNIRVCEHT